MCDKYLEAVLILKFFRSNVNKDHTPLKEDSPQRLRRLSQNIKTSKTIKPFSKSPNVESVSGHFNAVNAIKTRRKLIEVTESFNHVSLRRKIQNEPIKLDQNIKTLKVITPKRVISNVESVIGHSEPIKTRRKLVELTEPINHIKPRRKIQVEPVKRDLFEKNIRPRRKRKTQSNEQIKIIETIKSIKQNNSSEDLQKTDFIKADDQYMPSKIAEKLLGKKCTECGYLGPQKFDTIRHIRNIHLKLNEFQCNECYFSHYKLKVLKEHFRNIHQNKEIEKQHFRDIEKNNEPLAKIMMRKTAPKAVQMDEQDSNEIIATKSKKRGRPARKFQKLSSQKSAKAYKNGFGQRRKLFCQGQKIKTKLQTTGRHNIAQNLHYKKGQFMQIN